VATDRCGEIRERIQLLHVTRPRNREQTRDREFAGGAARPEAYFAPLHCWPERSLGLVVGGFHPALHDEREEMFMMCHERRCEIPHVFVRRVALLIRQGEEPLGDRSDLRDQLGTGERRTAYGGIAAKAVPQPEDAAKRIPRLRDRSAGPRWFSQASARGTDSGSRATSRIAATPSHAEHAGVYRADWTAPSPREVVIV